MLTNRRSERKEVIAVNALCIAGAIRIQVNEGRGVLLCRFGKLAEPVAAIRPEHGVLEGIMKDGWLLVKNPLICEDIPDDALIGLPLHGPSRSWQWQWDNEDVEIDICTAAGWTRVSLWELVAVTLEFS